MFLKADNLSKVYSSELLSDKGVSILQNAGIIIHDRETVDIFGRSGSGKTTLANLIAGAIPASSGRIFQDDKPVVCPYHGTLRRAIQMVYRHPEEALDSCQSLEQNLMELCRIHRPDFSGEGSIALLEQVGLYEEHLSYNPSSLSGGKLRRIALARTMSVSPKLILLNEPANILDSASQAQILQILKTY